MIIFTRTRRSPGFPRRFTPSPAILERGVVLDTGRDLQIDVAFINSLNLNRRPEHGKGGTNLDRGLKVVAHALEAFVREDMHLDEEVPVRRTVIAGLSVAFHPEAHPAVNTCGNVNGNLALDPGMPGAMTFAALPFRDLPPAAAHRAGRHADELAKYRLSGLAHLTTATAARADIGLFGLAARTRTCGTGFTVQDIDLLVGTSHCFFKRDLHAH